MWQMGNFGPMLGRAHYFLHYNPGKAPFAEEWFAAEARRLYSVLDSLLEKSEFMLRRLFHCRYRDIPLGRTPPMAAH